MHKSSLPSWLKLVRTSRVTNSSNFGFTLVEILIVAPIVILVIGIFVTAVVSMTGDVLATRAANSLAYNTQDALNQIERDVKLSGALLATNNINLVSPQGFNNDTTNFHNADSTNGTMLILNSYTTTTNPISETRDLIYTAGQPNLCSSPQINQNPPVMMNIIYFVKNGTLWRRVIGTSNYTSVGCDTPWQQPSCSTISGTFCKTLDMRLIDDVATDGFNVSYYPSPISETADSIASNIAQSDSARQTALQANSTVRVTINTAKTVAGRSISHSGTIRTVSPNDNSSTTSLQWKQISTSNSHSCSIGSDSQAYCWGRNNYGQLGIGSSDENPHPIPVAVTKTGALNGKTILAISTGVYYTCAIASDNNAYCWGANNYGGLGNNSTTPSYVPVPVDTAGALSGRTIRFIDTGGQLTCVIASDNLVYCWGRNGNGQLGNNSNSDSLIPVPVNTASVLSGKTIIALAVGESHVCVVASDNQAYCWGYNLRGQVGNSSNDDSWVPATVNTAGALSGKSIKAITASGGYYHTCAIASDNQAYCWGDNSSGGLGNNSTTSSSVPVSVNTAGALSGKTVKSITAGVYYTCAVASDNLGYCWGGNAEGQLGNNSVSQSNIPVAVNIAGNLNNKTIISIVAGGSHTCAIASDNLGYCWGYNIYGQLGNNLTTQSNVAVSVISQ